MQVGKGELKNFSGDVRITGTDRSHVSIHAVRRAERSRLERIRLEIRESRSKIEIIANQKDRLLWDWFGGDNNVVETDFEIELPYETDLDVKVFSSPVEIVGVNGNHDVSRFSSRLRLRDVSGSIHAKAFSGNIEIVMAESADAPELNLDTFSGDIKVTLPPAAAGNVEFRSFSGDLSSDYPLVFRSRNRRRLSAVLHPDDGRGSRVRNDLRFKTFSGDVQIRE